MAAVALRQCPIKHNDVGRRGLGGHSSRLSFDNSFDKNQPAPTRHRWLRAGGRLHSGAATVLAATPGDRHGTHDGSIRNLTIANKSIAT